MKLIITLFIGLSLSLPLQAADKYMQEFKNQDLRRDEKYKQGYKDLREEMKGDLEITNDLDTSANQNSAASSQAEDEEQAPQIKGPQGGSSGGPSIQGLPPGMQGSPNMTLQQAMEMGRALKDAQENNTSPSSTPRK